MKLVREIIAGSVSYPKAAEAYFGFWKEGMFVPVEYIGQWRQNAHNSRESFNNWASRLPTTKEARVRTKVVEITSEAAREIVGNRYRQEMTRNRPQAQQVLEIAQGLAGRWLASDLCAALALVATTDYSRKEKEALSDPWKYRHIYRAICSFLASKD